MAYADSWHVRSRARECAATHRHFIDGEAIVTALFPDPESSGYLRRDFTLEAWDARPADAEPPFSVWRGKFTAVISEEKPEVVGKDNAEGILQRLVEEDEDHTENTRYIIAVMLERQKLLRETDNQRTPTGILRVYEHRKTGEVFIIKDPDIPLNEIEKVQEEVIVLLENGGRLPTAQGHVPEQEGAAAAEEKSDAPSAHETDAAPPQAE
jgi:hypothetical protein